MTNLFKKKAAKEKRPKKSAKKADAKPQPKIFIVVRVRGLRGVRHKAEITLNILGGGGLHRSHGCVLVHSDTTSAKGMLQEVKDYVAYGDATPAILDKLFSKRGSTASGKTLSAEEIAKAGFGSAGEMSAALCDGKVTLQQLHSKGINTFFRLNAPKKGFTGSIKRSVGSGGVTGQHGAAISKLVERMI